MADPHNKSRYGEFWNQHIINLYLDKLNHIKQYVIFSGGWAWHFMSPINHKELKYTHDHKDVDIFVHKEDVVTVIQILKNIGFEKIHTRFPAGEADFRRYETVVEDNKLIIDFFVGNPPYITINGFKVIEPSYLLSLYKSIHSSDNCFAVKAAYNIIQKGESPINRKELVEIPITCN